MNTDEHRYTVAMGMFLAACSAAAAQTPAKFAVNEYFGVRYDREPVSCDVTFGRPVAADKIGLRPGPCQVEVLEGTPAAVKRARLWTLATMDPNHRQVLHTVTTDGSGAGKGPPAAAVSAPGKIGPIEVSTVTNSVISAKIPTGGATFDVPASAFVLPGPVASIRRDAADTNDSGKWIGSGYLDSTLRVEKVACQTSLGPVYFESKITYAFEGGRSYRVRARVYPSKPYVQLVEDFDVGGASKFVFNYDDWFTDALFRMTDSGLYGWKEITAPNPAEDFVLQPGQKGLARLVIWTQHNYFRGKQETIGLKSPDVSSVAAAYAETLSRHERDLERYKEALAKWEGGATKDPKRKPSPPQNPPAAAEFRETPYTYDGVSMRAGNIMTPPGKGLCVGGFYVRPDLWTKAKVNHVDQYMRPEVPGDRATRGVVGLAGARLRIAMEAWLEDLPAADGKRGAHREWAIFAVPAAERFWLAKAHVLEGIWPLDRLMRTPLVWNSDGSGVAPEDTAPPAGGTVGGQPASVMLGANGRAGMQTYNGSEGHIRGAAPPAAGWDGKVQPSFAKGGDILAMAQQAATCYMAADDSAYPSFRAMLPWSDPEAINPFYQGMENMNFNADLYRYITSNGLKLARMGHPEAERFIRHGEKSFDMALDRYVYPGSGCWEESHGYAGHTISVVGPLATALKNSKRKNFIEDVRFARMIEFFLYVHSPIDAEWGNRVVPAVGDHGQSRGGPADRFKTIVNVFTDAQSPEVKKIVRGVAWMIREDGGLPPAGVEPEKPDLSSRYLRGYGSVLRATGRDEQAAVLTLQGALTRDAKAAGADLFVVLRPTPDGGWRSPVAARAPKFNQADHAGTLTAGKAADKVELRLDMTINGDKWVSGGKGMFVVTMKKDGEAWAGTYAGTFDGRNASGAVTSRTEGRSEESFLVVRACQSWGHHHEDKGSLWGWFRNVHFFGDSSWGGPPGGTYGNEYKQGPAGGTQIEFVGVNNWPLPCKYPGPWIADDEYAGQFDYAVARCLYPYNPDLDLSKPSPAALRNGYDRQVLFVHPRGPAAGGGAAADLIVVRDNVESACPTIWRFHSFQPVGTTVNGARATLASPQNVVGEMEIVYPAGPWKNELLAAMCKGADYLKFRSHVPPRDVQMLRVNDRDILNDKYHEADGMPSPFESLPKFGGSLELRWDMPPSTSATWLFNSHDKTEPAHQARLLDPQGRAVAVKLHDGSEVVALMNIEPFKLSAEGIEFEGTAGLVIRKDGKATVHPIRCRTLKAK
jgi:hypothetical protein